MRRLSKKKNLEDWIGIENAEIDAILKEIADLPDTLKSLSSLLGEFTNLLRAIRKEKKKSLIKNAHARVRHLSDLFADLKEKFDILSKESENIEEVDNFIRDNFLIVQVKPYRRSPVDLHFNKNKSLIIGRCLTKVLGTLPFFSDKQLELFFKRGKFYCKNIGKNTTYMLDKDAGMTIFGERFNALKELTKEQVGIGKTKYVYSHVAGTANLILSFTILPLTED